MIFFSPKYAILLICILVIAASCQPRSQENNKIKSTIEFVDPLIGTGIATTPSAIKHSISGSELRGQTFPAVGVPHGMTQWSPQTQHSEKKCLSPYYYEDTDIQGFRGTHWMSGSCTQDYGSVTIMPIAGKLITNARQRASSFYRDEEKARPDSYSVVLSKYNIASEISATSRAGLLKFNYKAYNKRPYIIVEPNSDEGQAYINIDVENNMVYGYNPVHRIYQGWGDYAGFNGYFVMQFSKPIQIYGTYINGQITYENDEILAKGDTIGAFVGFDLLKELTVKVGTSFTGFDGALANLNAEIPGWNFDGVKKKSKVAWEKALNKIHVKGGTAEQRKKFYTALYHTNILPRAASDVDRRYVGFAEDSSMHQADGFDYYDDFSMWDTYRAVHPLMTILEPNKTLHMVKSLISKGEQGGWLPIFPMWNHYSAAMIGDHATSMICDAAVKGIDNFDKELAWKYMRQNAFQFNVDRASYVSGKGRRALDTYLKFGYLPIEEKVPDAFHKEEQVSRTLEYAYDDFALAKFAESVGRLTEGATLKDRSRNWRNVFDTSIGFVRGRHEDGSWFEPFLRDDPRAPYITEGTPFQYTWYVPHDIYGLIDAIGGKEIFVEKLDTLFEKDQYWHGNEPGHQTAYLYAFAGAPWKTQKWINFIIKEEYGLGPGGLSGNEDAGQMSAWLIFSMVGFYPVCPGTPYYIIGAPSFEETTFNLENGNKFVIKGNNLSERNIYIQSAKFNGAAFNRAWLNHDEIIGGGELIFEMGDKPNMLWASKNDELPPDVMNQ